MNGTRCRVWRATTPPHSLNTALHRYTPHGQVHIHMLTLGALASARTRSLQTSHTRSTLPTSHSFPLVITTPIMSCVPNAQHPPWPWRFPREIHAAPPDTRAAHFTEAARRRQARASVSLARRDNPAMAARSLVMAFLPHWSSGQRSHHARARPPWCLSHKRHEATSSHMLGTFRMPVVHHGRVGKPRARRDASANT